MKKISKILALVALSAIMVPSCDIVEEPYLIPVSGGQGPGERNVLLEDFTGHKCPNCPEAAEIAHGLKALYGDQLIIITVHAGFYATPDNSGNYTDDFRTQVGTDLNDYFGFEAYPSGMVNRTEYDGSKVLYNDSWESAIGVQAELDAQASITITNTYAAGTRMLDCLLETEFLENMEGTFNICAYITESGIIAPQKTEQGVVLDYEHNHVLRASMNGTWGDLVGEDGQAVVETKLTNSYSYTLPEGWNADSCTVVAFIYNTTTNEVVQAEEKRVN